MRSRQPAGLILPDRERDGWTKLSHHSAVYRVGGPTGGKGDRRPKVSKGACLQVERKSGKTYKEKLNKTIQMLFCFL